MMVHNQDRQIMRGSQFSGVYVVTVTPFDEAGALDEPAIRRLVDLLVDEGADGLTIAGSTGEWFALSDA